MVSVSGASILPLFGVTSAKAAVAQVQQLASQLSTPVQSARTAENQSKASDESYLSPGLDRVLQQCTLDTVALQEGTLSPLSERAISYDGNSPSLDAARGRLYEGKFAEGVLGGDYQPRTAAFDDRQVAMLNAYHFASDLAVEAKDAARSLTAIAGGKGGPWYDDAAQAMKEVARNTSVLAVQFNFTADVVAKAADGSASMRGFEVRHDKFGLMLSVDEAGTITFYDQAGTAYSAEDYASAKPDGIIPELLNDLVDQADQARRLNIRV